MTDHNSGARLLRIWEEPLDLNERQNRYKAIEAYRQRPLIVYATSSRPGAMAQMGNDAVREFIDQVDKIKGENVDVLIHSLGGDALAAWKLMSVLREHFKSVHVLVPSAAFSAATIFALGAETIVMHPNASLGPIDPQIQVKMPDGRLMQFAYEDLVSFIRFVDHDLKLSEQEFRSAVVDRLFASTDPVVVGAAKRASDLASDVGARMLSLHEKDAARTKAIAANLNKSFFAHGDAVSRERAKELKLQIAKPDAALEALIWNAFLAIEKHMHLREPFDVLRTYLADPRGKATLQPMPPLNIPPNMPQPLMAQIWQDIAQQTAARALAGPVEVPFTLVSSMLESTRLAAEHRTVAGITATRAPDGSINVSVTEYDKGWRQTWSDNSPHAAPQPPPGSTEGPLSKEAGQPPTPSSEPV